MKTILTLTLLLAINLPATAAAPVSKCNSTIRICKASIKSQNFTVPVLELYTSQGCSSCPPAEAFLLRLYRNGLTNKVVPLAFHVDYWDNLGWKDPYASRAWSNRQRHEARRMALRTIYTPQFVFFGINFLSYPNLGKAIATTNTIKPRANITIKATLKGNLLSVISKVQPASKVLGRNMEVYFAISENGLSDHIRTGENAGRKLENDFVVRTFRKIGTNSEISTALPPAWKPANLNVVVYARDRDSGETYQSAILPLKQLR